MEPRLKSGKTAPAQRPQPGFVQTLFAVVWKDLTAEMRSRELLSAMLVFALLVIFIFNFALELAPSVRSEVTAGVLWVTFTFAGTLGLNRSMAMEKDRGCLDGLLLAPVERSAIYFGKAVGNLTFILIMAAIILPLYALFYGINVFRPGLLLVILLGSVGYTAIGTLLATMAVQTRTRDVLLPILLFPITLPVLIASVKASSGFLEKAPDLSAILPWLNFLIAYDIIFIALAFMFFDYLVEE